MVASAGHKSIAAFNFMHQIIFEQKVEGAINCNRCGARAMGGHALNHIVSAHRGVTFGNAGENIFALFGEARRACLFSSGKEAGRAFGVIVGHGRYIITVYYFYNGRNDVSGLAKVTVFIENEKVIVTEYRFEKPGDNTGWHRHGHDYVVVPLLDGKLKLETAAGSSIAEMKKGVPYFRSEGVEHDVINASDGEYAFIEIELK